MAAVDFQIIGDADGRCGKSLAVQINQNALDIVSAIDADRLIGSIKKTLDEILDEASPFGYGGTKCGDLRFRREVRSLNVPACRAAGNMTARSPAPF